MSSTSEAAMTRGRTVGAVEPVVCRRVGVEVSLSAVGRRQVDPFGDGALHLQELLPVRFGGCWRGCSGWDRVGHDGLS